MKQVTICLMALGRAAYNIPGWAGPCLGKQDKSTSGKSKFAVATDKGLWGKAGGDFSTGEAKAAGVQVTVNSRGVVEAAAQSADAPSRPPPRRKKTDAAPAAAAAPAPSPAPAPSGVDADDVQGMMDLAKNDIVLGTLKKYAGSCSYEVLFEVAEQMHCDVLAAALLSLKRSKQVEYDGAMLLMPVHKDVQVTATGGAPAAKSPPKIPKSRGARAAAPQLCSGPPAACHHRRLLPYCSLPSSPSHHRPALSQARRRKSRKSSQPPPPRGRTKQPRRRTSA